MKTRLGYEYAHQKALDFVSMIRPYCERVEIAGSLRRKKDEVGDIEIVCIAKRGLSLNLFNEPVESISLLDQYIDAHLATFKNGPHYKQIPLADINIDLFITTAEQWGVIFAIRTGSADFSKWLVTWRKNGGALPSNMFVRDGRLQTATQVIDTPEEIDFFKAIGLGWIAPENRGEGRWYR